MFRALAWKEYREHRSVWLAMTFLTALLLFGLVEVLTRLEVAGSEEEKRIRAVLAALTMTGIYGLVCGAMLLAGEREARTLGFLDLLPVRRVELWAGKAILGLLFTLTQALSVVAVVFALGLDRPASVRGGWPWALPAVAVEAFAYGLLGSALTRSVLAAIAVAVGPLLLSWAVGGALTWPPRPAPLLIRATLAGAVLAASGLIFARAEQERQLRRASAERLRVPVARPPRPWQALLWLTFRQGRTLALLLALAGFGFGLVLPAGGLMLWPAATLLVGVLCGTAMFLGEQSSGFNRFLGDQRFPAGRVWLAKAGLWFGVAILVSLLILLGATLHTLLFRPQGMLYDVRPDLSDGSRLLGHSTLLVFLPKGLFLLLWLAYGFSIGQVYALVWRKSAVAVVVAYFVSAAAAAVWMPSLLSGGLHLWLILAIPVLLLAATRLVLWTWVSDRLQGTALAAWVLGCGGLVGLWTTASFALRAVEVPDVGEPFDVRAFKASLPTAGSNLAGRAIQQAALDLDNLEGRTLEAEQPHGFPDDAREAAAFEEQLAQVVENGWLVGDRVLSDQVEMLCHNRGWIRQLKDAAALPLGVVDDPEGNGGLLARRAIDRSPRMALLLSARALQPQAEQPQAALDHLSWALALSRNLRHKASPTAAEKGRAVQDIALQGFAVWLEQLGPQPQLLRAALAELNRHETELPPLTDCVKTEYLRYCRGIDEPSRWLASGLLFDDTARMESDLVALSWQTPWERPRVQRIINLIARDRLQQVTEASLRAALGQAGRGGREHALFRAESGSYLKDSPLLRRLVLTVSWLGYEGELFALCRLRAARLKTALALYAAETGKPATSLEELVPRYLPELPVDPFSGRPFGYRVSPGEQIQAHPRLDREPLQVQAGQGVLWSVGPDGNDDGGTQQGEHYRNSVAESAFPAGYDRIFLVPRRP